MGKRMDELIHPEDLPRLWRQAMQARDPPRGPRRPIGQTELRMHTIRGWRWMIPGRAPVNDQES